MRRAADKRGLRSKYNLLSVNLNPQSPQRTLLHYRSSQDATQSWSYTPLQQLPQVDMSSRTSPRTLAQRRQSQVAASARLRASVGRATAGGTTTSVTAARPARLRPATAASARATATVQAATARRADSPRPATASPRITTAPTRTTATSSLRGAATTRRAAVTTRTTTRRAAVAARTTTSTTNASNTGTTTRRRSAGIISREDLSKRNTNTNSPYANVGPRVSTRWTPTMEESPNSYQRRLSLHAMTEVYCPICLMNIKREKCRIIATDCGHVFCNICLTEAHMLKKVCPLCQRDIDSNDFRELFM